MISRWMPIKAEGRFIRWKPYSTRHQTGISRSFYGKTKNSKVKIYKNEIQKHMVKLENYIVVATQTKVL